MRPRPRRPRGSRQPRLISELLPGVLKGLRGPKGSRMERLGPVWVEVAGESTATRTRLSGLESGVLTIEVESAALKHHLTTFRRETLLGQLQERLPDLPLHDLRFRVGKAGPRPPRESDSASPLG